MLFGGVKSVMRMFASDVIMINVLGPHAVLFEQAFLLLGCAAEPVWLVLGVVRVHGNNIASKQ